jgi:mono/diheme cytochrome c family protein
VADVAAAAPPAPPASGKRPWRWVLAPALAFALFALTAGILSAHDPRAGGYFRLFFEDTIHMKAGFATVAAVLALFQVLSAAWIFRKLPWDKPPWMNAAHRWSGRLAFLATLPVAYHCIFKLGFADADGRVLAHSLFGTFVYGAYASKITIVKLKRFPGPTLPVAGGLLFATLIGVWYTSALWLYDRPAPSRTASAVPANADAAAGARVFADAGCGGCHTFAAARAAGSLGPNLDTLRPGFEQVRRQVERGGGAMPSFGGTLTPAQIRDVAAFVAERAGPAAR